MKTQTLSYIFLNFSILSYIFLNIHLYRAFGSNCRILFLQCRTEIDSWLNVLVEKEKWREGRKPASGLPDKRIVKGNMWG
jgi:hypothetical protein